MPLSLWSDGIIINWNKAAERIFGYAARRSVGQH
jgi:PAS domain S-box-containing protein